MALAFCHSGGCGWSRCSSKSFFIIRPIAQSADAGWDIPQVAGDFRVGVIDGINIEREDVGTLGVFGIILGMAIPLPSAIPTIPYNALA